MPLTYRYLLRLCAYPFLVALLTFSSSLAIAESVLIDLESGQHILEDSADDEVESACVTSLMAIFSSLEFVRQNNIDIATPVRNPWSTSPEVTVEKIPFSALLQILLLNGSATALRELPISLGLTPEAFDALMASDATRLGLQQSSFHLTCSGSTRCVTSARDVAKLSIELISLHPEVLPWAQQQKLNIPGIPEQKSSNFFLERSHAVRGLFVHSEQSANAVILTENETSGDAFPRRLLAIDIGSPNQEQLHKRIASLLLRGWRDFETVHLYRKGEQITSLPVLNGTQNLVRTRVTDDLFVTLNRERLIESGTSSFGFRVRYSSPIIAPIHQGAPLGVLDILDGDKVLCSANLSAAEDIPTGSFWKRFLDKLRLSSR